MAGEPVIIIQTQDSILSVQAVTASGNDPINVGFGTNSEASVNFRGSFPDGGNYDYFIYLFDSLLMYYLSVCSYCWNLQLCNPVRTRGRYKLYEFPTYP